MEKTPYDRRMEVLDRIKHEHADKNVEIDAAVATYERLKTAKAIAETVFESASDATVASLAAEIGAEARHIQRRRSRE